MSEPLTHHGLTDVTEALQRIGERLGTALTAWDEVTAAVGRSIGEAREQHLEIHSNLAAMLGDVTQGAAEGLSPELVSELNVRFAEERRRTEVLRRRIERIEEAIEGARNAIADANADDGSDLVS